VVHLDNFFTHEKPRSQNNTVVHLNLVIVLARYIATIYKIGYGERPKIEFSLGEK
jgi:hypothetical protein